jgi:ferredoxin
VKITVDPDRCVGSAYCQRIAPANFDLGDDGIAVVLNTDAAGADAASAAAAAAAVREAEAACPAMAISIQEA